MTTTSSTDGNKKYGILPRAAQLELQRASKIGEPGSLVRRKAIDRAYAYIELHHPEFLR